MLLAEGRREDPCLSEEVRESGSGGRGRGRQAGLDLPARCERFLPSPWLPVEGDGRPTPGSFALPVGTIQRRATDHHLRRPRGRPCLPCSSPPPSSAVQQNGGSSQVTAAASPPHPARKKVQLPYGRKCQSIGRPAQGGTLSLSP